MIYASIVPLIGGETIAMQNVFGKKPEYILSYSAFKANDLQLLNHYQNTIPYYSLDESNSNKNTQYIGKFFVPIAIVNFCNRFG